MHEKVFIMCFKVRLSYNTNPDPWVEDPWGNDWKAYENPQTQQDIFDALVIMRNNINIAEISVKVSDNGHYVCIRRVDDKRIEVGQVRVEQGRPIWLER